MKPRYGAHYHSKEWNLNEYLSPGKRCDIPNGQKLSVICFIFIMCQCMLRPEEGISFAGAGVTSGCEPPDVGAENRALVLWKSGVHS